MPRLSEMPERSTDNVSPIRGSPVITGLPVASGSSYTQTPSLVSDSGVPPSSTNSTRTASRFPRSASPIV